MIGRVIDGTPDEAPPTGTWLGFNGKWHEWLGLDLKEGIKEVRRMYEQRKDDQPPVSGEGFHDVGA